MFKHIFFSILIFSNDYFVFGNFLIEILVYGYFNPNILSVSESSYEAMNRFISNLGFLYIENEMVATM